MIHGAILTISLALAFAPPLTDQQRADVSTAQDGADHREQAFYALIENVRSWTAPPTDDGEPIRLSLDLVGLLENPDDARGELFRIDGELLQQTPLDPPYEDVSEWFVRDDRSDRAVMVYVVRTDVDQHFAEREQVSIDGRFYKSMRFTARDGKARDYPAFVGRFPQRTATSALPAASHATFNATNVRRLSIIGGIVMALLVAFVLVRRWVGKQARHQPTSASRLRANWPHDAMSEVDDAADLPDDPAEALAELRRRAQAGSS